MVIDFSVLDEEFTTLKEYGIEPKIKISTRAHIVTSFHREMDEREDEIIGIGTTKRGIGPAYETKVKRVGIRVGDVFDDNIFIKRLKIATQLWGIYEEERILKEANNIKSMVRKFKDRIVDTEIWLHGAITSGKNILFEGSQAALLDIDFGTYPYVTSSSTISGGICSGLGIPPNYVHKIMGVMKPYMTRVGEGPFPTEIYGEEAKILRDKGNEYGATTGRPRRVGWLDLPLLRYATMVGGVKEIALTKVDILEGMEEIPVAVEYECNGQRRKYPPLNIENCKPIYAHFEGWNSIEDKGFQNYVKMIEKETGVKVMIISYGEKRESTKLID
jgi:adenylosuccinate synthase